MQLIICNSYPFNKKTPISKINYQKKPEIEISKVEKEITHKHDIKDFYTPFTLFECMITILFGPIVLEIEKQKTNFKKSMIKSIILFFGLPLIFYLHPWELIHLNLCLPI